MAELEESGQEQVRSEGPAGPCRPLKKLVTLAQNFPYGSTVKNCLQCGRHGLIPGSRKSHGERNRYPLQCSGPREFHGQRTHVSDSPQGCKGLDH